VIGGNDLQMTACITHAVDDKQTTTKPIASSSTTTPVESISVAASKTEVVATSSLTPTKQKAAEVSKKSLKVSFFFCYYLLTRTKSIDFSGQKAHGLHCLNNQTAN
jgi:hypothetical protein